jgi:outer membrane protein OmpA-like peptidoglycan-associated protein
MSEKKGTKWSTPVNLGPAVNSEKWETQPTLSPDGQELIFVSNRPGGLGGNDLWHCMRQSDGSWSPARNLGAPVNTAYDEGGPFLHPDGLTLFFSSNGHAGMGDKDLFSSSREGNQWGEPRNLGYPINTRGSENYMVVNSTGTTGYISLEREGGYGMQDLYRFDIPASMRPKPVTFLKGVVTSRKNNAPIEARLEIIDLASNSVKARCSSDPVNGSFLISLPAGSSYALNASAEGHLFYSENYTLTAELKATDVFEVNIPLTPIETGEKIVLHNIFFASGSSNLEERSQTEIEILQLFLQRNASLRIEIGGHTDDVGNDAANLKLSQERADAVRSALIAKGIDAGRIVAKGYGETKPVASNQNEAGRAQNRRTEFSIVGK